MSDVPFGFGLPDRDPERRDKGEGGNPAGDPFGLGALFGSIGAGGSPEDLMGKMPLFAELQKLMSWSGGPVNWDLARQGAISQLAAGHQPTSQAEQTGVAESLRLADLWLDQVTELPSGIERTAAWSRVDWVEKTLPAWNELIDPLAEKVVAAMTGALPQEAAATTVSTQPSTRASSVSSRRSAICCSGVSSGSSTPLPSSCWMLSGSVGSMPPMEPIASLTPRSMASRSTVMPRA